MVLWIGGRRNPLLGVLRMQGWFVDVWFAKMGGMTVLGTLLPAIVGLPQPGFISTQQLWLTGWRWPLQLPGSPQQATYNAHFAPLPPRLQAPAGAPLPDMAVPAMAFPAYQQPGSDQRLVARLEGLYLKPRDLPELAEQAKQAAASVVEAAKRQDPSLHQPPLVLLDLPCTMFAVRTNRYLVHMLATTLEPALPSLCSR